jgi:hypothetical protein
MELEIKAVNPKSTAKMHRPKELGEKRHQAAKPERHIERYLAIKFSNQSCDLSALNLWG